MSKLIIVKSATVAKRLGSMFPEHKVIATQGGLLELPADRLGAEAPEYVPEYFPANDKVGVIARVRRAANAADRIYVLGEPSCAGEAFIDQVRSCIQKGNREKIYRVYATVLTQSAIEKALTNAQRWDEGIVHAYRAEAHEARKLIDRAIRYTISPLLNEKLNAISKQPEFVTLSWQSWMALRQIQKREENGRKENENGTPKKSNTQILKVKLKKAPVTWEAEYIPAAQDIHCEATLDAVRRRTAELEVVKIEKHTPEIPAPAPLNTQEFLYGAIKDLKLSAAEILEAAKQLWELGFISYYQTDGDVHPDEFDAEARQFVGNYGLSAKPEYPHAVFGPEGIRVSDLERVQCTVDDEIVCLVYEWLWEQTLQSVLTNAVEQHTTVWLSNDSGDLFIATGVYEFEAGWRGAMAKVQSNLALNRPLRYSPPGTRARRLPSLAVGESLAVIGKSILDPETADHKKAYCEHQLLDDLIKRELTRCEAFESTTGIGDAWLSENLRQGLVWTDESGHLSTTALGRCVVELLKDRFACLNRKYMSELMLFVDGIECGATDYAEWMDAVCMSLEIQAQSYEALPIQLSSELRRELQRYHRQPMAQTTESTVRAGDVCPACGAWLVVERRIARGKHRGKQYLGCGGFPACKFFRWHQSTANDND